MVWPPILSRYIFDGPEIFLTIEKTFSSVTQFFLRVENCLVDWELILPIENFFAYREFLLSIQNFFVDRGSFCRPRNFLSIENYFVDREIFFEREFSWWSRIFFRRSRIVLSIKLVSGRFRAKIWSHRTSHGTNENGKHTPKSVRRTSSRVDFWLWNPSLPDVVFMTKALFSILDSQNRVEWTRTLFSLMILY